MAVPTKAAFVKAPFQFMLKEIHLRDLMPDEVLLEIKACGICGTDLHAAATEAKDWQPFGHEIAGIVREVGENVQEVKVGDRVILESGSFCGRCSFCRNGRADLCNKGRNFWSGESLGFAEYMLAPANCLVPLGNLSFAEGALVEPLGVALDLIYTAGIELNDDVVVVGLGPIGLMALRLAKAMGARHVFGAELSQANARIELARKFGATEVIYTDKMVLTDYHFSRGGVEKVLVTAPPYMIEPSMQIAGVGGVVAFSGFSMAKALRSFLTRMNFISKSCNCALLLLPRPFISPVVWRSLSRASLTHGR